jgi:hypothetical protein
VNTWACKLQKSSHEETEWVDTRESQDKNIDRRIFVLLLMVYLAIMVSVARWGVVGNLFDGFSWHYPGFGLFPIPFFGSGVTPVEVPLTLVDLFIYLIFIGHGIWIFGCA